MTDGSEGYMTEMEYIYTYHSHLNPLHMQLALVSAGYAPPAVATACELGFGQGISVNVHAAASSAAWYGTDFHQDHAAFAQELATASSSEASLFNQSFAEFCSRSDLPDFDFIVLHGIWTWTSDANRDVIVDFVRRKLKPGGVLSISYNTLHGWAAMLPARDLLTEHAQRMSPPSLGIASRIDAALEFADCLMAASPHIAKSSPQVVERLAAMKVQDRRYVAGEYFSRNWHPMSFSEMTGWLAPSNLSFACSDNYLDQVDAGRLTLAQRKLLQTIPDPLFRETVRDFCLEQPFRKDYWVKKAQRLSSREQVQALHGQRVVLVHPQANVRFKVALADGDASMTVSEGGPLLDALADHQPHALGDLAHHVYQHGMNFDRLLQFVLAMAGNGFLQAAQEDRAISNAAGKGAVRRLNAILMHKAKMSQVVNYLASPVTGGGVPVERYHQLFLLARSEGLESPDLWAQKTLGWLVANGEHVERAVWRDRQPADILVDLVRQAQATGHKDPQTWAQATLAFLQEHGRPLVEPPPPLLTPEQELRELIAQARVFADRHLSMLMSLGVV